MVPARRQDIEVTKVSGSHHLWKRLTLEELRQYLTLLAWVERLEVDVRCYSGSEVPAVPSELEMAHLFQILPNTPGDKLELML
jgi:hypothetical protein